ncbi:uncharacterized protein [Apostichopus japonicus]|uniref:uncharacterized protein isoform X1 n=1 Tax=Stichopus japonicus TaxID=307972 RepID=UPI003AB24D38
MKNPLYISVVILFIASDVLFFGKGTNATKRYKEPKYYTLYLYEFARDCEDAVHDDCGTSRLSGDYLIQPDGYNDQPFKAYCDCSQNDGTAWTIIQRRADLDSTVTFNRSWEDYRLGFGLSPNDFWIGNEKLSYLTNQNTYQLRIDMTTSNGSSIHVTYDNFRISDEFSGYKLLSTGKFNFSSEDGVIESCPHNMRYGYCVSQRICPDPDDSIPCRRNEESCFCPEEFQLNGDECVAPGECDDCFLEGTETEEGVTIEAGGSYVSPSCSRNCSCVDGNVTCVNYMCSVNATCNATRNNAGQCYCKTGYVGDGTVCRYPKDCLEIFEHDDMAESRVYTIQPNKNRETTLEVFCDDGGWTLIQRRVDLDSTVTFNRSWEDYRLGFGLSPNDFWIGNEKLSYLTNQNTYQLRIDMTTSNGSSIHVTYDNFRISDDELSGYRLLSTGKFTFSSEDGVIESCPHNMRYGYCVSQRICPDPDDSIPCRRNEESCFCPEEFQLNGDECVAPGECDDCFLEGTETEEGVTIEAGGSYVSPSCSRNCSCVDGNVTCVNYMCSVNAICNATRNNAGQCYCKTGYVGDGTVCRYPKDCLEIFEHDDMAESRVYTIQPNKNSESTLEVFCDDGGWTLIQRRADLDSTVTFNRSWEDYRVGFGLSPNDFWIGNEKLSYLTNQKSYQLRIDMTTSNGSSIHVTYDNFRISDDELSGYKLLSTGKFNFSSEDGVIESCPHNMRYGYCVSQRICPDPDDSIPCRRNEESCFCPEEFQLNGDECVAPGECDDCFLEGTETEEGVTIEAGGSYVYPNCSLNCSCVDGNVTCVSYTCSVNATCKVLNNAGQCHCEKDYVDDGTVCRYPTDCMEIFEHDDMAESRVYTIQPNKNRETTLEVFCNMSDGGGWTVFQRRFNGSQNFALPEQNYSEGFGSLLGEFWLGNENLYTLTNQMQYELKIDFMDINNNSYKAQYSLFQISNKPEKYALQLGDFKGNAGDSLTAYSNHQPFLTDLTAAWQAVTVSQSSDSVTSVHTPTQYDYSVQHDEGNGNTDDESVQEFTEFLKPISIGPWWHRQDETMTIECDLNGNYSNMFWFTIPQRIASTGMKIRPTKK